MNGKKKKTQMTNKNKFSSKRQYIFNLEKYKTAFETNDLTPLFFQLAYP